MFSAYVDMTYSTLRLQGWSQYLQHSFPKTKNEVRKADFIPEWVIKKDENKKEMTRVGFEPTPTNVDQETGNSY